jgi:hypothetical protein
MAYGISRVNGGVVSETLHGGYQTVWLTLANTGNVFTADSGGSGSAITEGGYSKAIRAIQTIGTTVFIGPRANGGICVGLDNSAQPTGPAYDSDTSPTVAERVKAVVDSALSTTTTVVTLKTLAYADFA